MRVTDEGKPDDRLPRRPASARAIALPVPPVTRSLKLDVIAARLAHRAGRKTQVDVAVKDFNGRAVAGAELAVVVVNQAVLALSGYKTPDPLAVFYAARPPGASDFNIRQYVTLAKPDVATLDVVGTRQRRSGRRWPRAAGPGARCGGGAGRDKDARASARTALRPSSRRAREEEGGWVRLRRGRHDQSLRSSRSPVRKNFDALAVFAPAVKTDAQRARHGRGQAARQPDALPHRGDRGRRRASSSARARASITARLPLMVRPTPPRFLNFGDTFELPVVVQNQTDAPMTVKLAVRATNAALTDGCGPPRSPCRPTIASRCGSPPPPRWRAPRASRSAARPAAAADAAEFALPVWTPATTEAFATYGEIDDGAIAQPVALPGKVVTAVRRPRGHDRVDRAPGADRRGALPRALPVRVRRAAGLARPRDRRAARRARRASRPKDCRRPTEIEAQRRRATSSSCADCRTTTAASRFWGAASESWPYLAVYVATRSCAPRPRASRCPAHDAERSEGYLQRHRAATAPGTTRPSPGALCAPTRCTCASAWATSTSPRPSSICARPAASTSCRWRPSAGCSARSPATAARPPARRRSVASLDNRVSETAGAAHFTTALRRRRLPAARTPTAASTAILLEALIDEQPKSDLIPKLVTRPARAPQGGPLGQHAGERVRAARPRPLLPAPTRR